MDTPIQINQHAPEFNLPDLQARPHLLADYRGRIVVINFWSAECPWAERADAALLPMLAKWGEQVTLLSIAANANESHDLLVAVAEQRGIPLVLHDAEQETAALYGAQTTPHIFVLDAEGILRYQGAFDDVTFRQPEPTQNFVQQAVAALLAGNDPDPAEVPSYGCTVVYHSLEE
ncbi:MAG: redoxin domain-containing protein [Anaerolineae bacterium]|nr:redoxin domain-containing protein [Anaerolineae bacterium]